MPSLMLFQLNIPNWEEMRQRMMPDPRPAVAIPDVAGHARRMAGVIGVREGGALGHAELGFDQVQPRGVGRGVGGRNPALAQLAEEPRVVVDVRQIVKNQVEGSGDPGRGRTAAARQRRRWCSR